MADRTDIEEMLSEAQQEQRQEAADRAPRRWKRCKRMLGWVRHHPRRGLALGIALIVVVTLLVPPLRYGLGGLFIRRDLRITVLDEQTGEPVSKTTIKLRDKAAQTDANGQVVFSANEPGEPAVTAEKQYYQTTTTAVKIGLLRRTYEHTIRLTATGRAVPVRVTNRITGTGIGNVSITAGGTEGTTDENGEATMVFDSSVSSVEAELRADGYNTTRSNFTVPGDIAANTVALTPTGRVYVLSKQSGNLDVVKVNLDGSDRQVVVKATGREEVNNTEIYATNDWQFVVLKARRDGVQAALYLLDTSTDKLTDLDTAAVDFNIAGWHDHQFVYSTYDSKRQPWNPKQQELKVFDADSGQRTMLLSTAAQGNSYDNYLAQSLAGVFFVGDKLVYGVQWSGSGPDLSKQFATIQEVSLPSLTARELRKDKGASLIMSRATPTAVNVQITTDKPDSYQYLNGNLTEINMSTEELLRAVPSYIPGPANQYLWDELVDGASQVYVAEGSLQTKHVVMPAGEFRAFGWYGGDYVLLSKNGSELFIIPTDSTTQTVPQKVVDYHRPPGQGI